MERRKRTSGVGNMNISVIIVTRNNFDYFEKCMNALFEHTDFTDVELLIVNNNSSDRESKQLIEWYEAQEFLTPDIPIQLIHNVTTESFATNNNEAIRLTNSNYLMFLNDDTEVQENWLPPLLDCIESDERIVAVGPKMFYPNGMIQHCGIAFHKKDKMPGHIWLGKKPRDYPPAQIRRRFKAITGGAMFISARVFKSLGGFDEAYKVCAYEDIDLCLKFEDEANRIYYEPKSEIMHHESVTQNKFDAKFRQGYFVANTKIFLDRWFEKIKPDYFDKTNGEEE